MEAGDHTLPRNTCSEYDVIILLSTRIQQEMIRSPRFLE